MLNQKGYERNHLGILPEGPKEWGGGYQDS